MITIRIHIDTVFLLRQVSALAQVKSQRRTWNEFGEKIASDLKTPPPAFQPMIDGEEPSAVPESSIWEEAKELVHAVLTSRDPKHDAIRKRLGNLQNPSTPALLSTLSLWLAGALGISVSATRPMVAVMLYAVAQAMGDWEILRS